MKTPTIDQFLTEYALDSRHRSYKRIGYLNALARELRAHLATQPNTPSDAKTVGAALEYSAQPPAITPEQAVAVLVAHGGKKARLNDVWYSSLIRSEREKYVLVLPAATPEPTP